MDQSEYLGLKEVVEEELLMRYRLQRLRTGLPDVNRIEDTLATIVRALRFISLVYIHCQVTIYFSFYVFWKWVAVELLFS